MNRPRDGQVPDTEIRAHYGALILSEIPALLEAWQTDRDAPAALGLLSAWGAVNRMTADQQDEATCAALEQQVRQDVKALRQAWPGPLQAEVWEKSLRALRRADENAVTAAEEEAAEDRALQLFLQLDDSGLALWALRALLPEDTELTQAQEAIDACEATWTVFARSFWAVGPYARDMELVFAADLDHRQPTLACTATKYAILRDQFEQADGPCEWGVLSQAETQSIMDQTPAVATAVREGDFGQVEQEETLATTDLALAADEAQTPDLSDTCCIDFEALDRSWHGCVILDEESPNAMVTVHTAQGAAIPAGTLECLGIAITIEDGCGETPGAAFCKAWYPCRTAGATLVLRQKDGISEGRILPAEA